MTSRLPPALAGGVLGAGVAVAIALLLGGGYRSSAALRVLPAAGEAVSPAGRASAEVQAATYAALVERPGFLEQVRAQVIGGRLSTEELAARVDGRHPDGTALVEIVAEGGSAAEARGLAGDLASALLGSLQQAARQRAAQVEDELSRRIDDVNQAIQEAPGDESLLERRAALAEELAQAAAGAVQEGTRLELAAPAGEAERAGPLAWPLALAGAVAGLLLGALVRVPRRRVERPAAVVSPEAGAVLAGEVGVATDPPGAPVEWSTDGAAWASVEGAWDTAEVADGRYLLRAAGSAEAVPVEVDNHAPRVRLEEPERYGGRLLLRAEAEDSGSGVASVTFMVSDGSAEWSEVPAEWEPPAPGVWWLCALAADRAGNRASSELVPVRVESYDSGGMPTSVVTGGAGFLGSHLCEHLLEQGHRVICVDNLVTSTLENLEHLRSSDFVFLNHDVVEHIAIDEPVDFVYHLAALASPIDYLRQPLHSLKVGSYGTHNALGLAKYKRARFFLASTSEVYGDPLQHPQRESYWGNVNPIGPRGVYDEAKRYAEAMAMAYHTQQGVDTCIARIFNTFGMKMRPHDGRAIPTFVRQALEDAPITVFGTGQQTRSFCYVDDLIRGIVLLAESGEHLPVNLGNPDEFTLLELAELVIRLSGSKSEIVFEALPEDDPQQRQPDITRAKELLGWEPTIPLEEGLRRLLAFHGRVPEPVPG